MPCFGGLRTTCSRLTFLASLLLHGALLAWLSRSDDSEPQVIAPRPGYCSVALMESAATRRDLPETERAAESPKGEVRPKPATPALPAALPTALPTELPELLPVPARIETKPAAVREPLGPKLLAAPKTLRWPELAPLPQIAPVGFQPKSAKASASAPADVKQERAASPSPIPKADDPPPLEQIAAPKRLPDVKSKPVERPSEAARVSLCPGERGWGRGGSGVQGEVRRQARACGCAGVCQLQGVGRRRRG